jgi:hypothetical protein
MRIKIELSHEQVDQVRQLIDKESKNRLFDDEYQEYCNRKLVRGIYPKSYVEWLENKCSALISSDRREWRPVDDSI